MLKTIEVMVGVAVAPIGVCFFGQFLALSVYRRLFGILYRHVSVEYAEPVSFWVTMIMSFCLGAGGYVVFLVVI
jgi:hypothetical protein